MYDRESVFRTSSHSSQYLLKLLRANITKLKLPAHAQIVNIKISRQKFKRPYTSKRRGFKVTLLLNLKHPNIEPTFWFKQVDNPKELYENMAFVHSALKAKGIESPVPEPFLFDENENGILMSFKKGLNLFFLTITFCWPFVAPLVRKLPEYYFRIGNWLQRYHDTMQTGRVVTTRSLLEELHCTVRDYGLISGDERQMLLDQISSLSKDSIAGTAFKMVRPHNDVTLRNILVKPDLDFVLMDWDNIVNPGFPIESWCWSDITCLLNNLQSVLRFHPLVSKHKIRSLCQSLLYGYFNENESVSGISVSDYVEKLHYIQTLRNFFGIDIDRPLFEIHRSRLTWRFVAMLRKNLLDGKAYML